MTGTRSPSEAIAFAGRAENLLLADLAIRSFAGASRSVLFADLPINSPRRRSAIRRLIDELGWSQVHLGWYVKISLLPAPLKRLTGLGLDSALRLAALSLAVAQVWRHLLTRRGCSIALICGRPGVAFLLCCRLARPQQLILLDSGPKQDVFSHLQASLRILRRLPARLGGFADASSAAEALALLTDQPIPLLCWSTERYSGSDQCVAQLAPVSVSEFVERFPAPPPLGDPQAPPCVFLIGKSDGTREDIQALIRLWSAQCAHARPIYFRHPREACTLATDLLEEHGISIADPALSIEGHAMRGFRAIHLQHVFAIRRSQSLMTLRVLYGPGFRITLLR